jgi:plasmid stabilization system protein ParE
MAILNWTYEAERWLHEIHTYIAIDNPKSANQVIAGIYKSAIA